MIGSSWRRRRYRGVHRAGHTRTTGDPAADRQPRDAFDVVNGAYRHPRRGAADIDVKPAVDTPAPAQPSTVVGGDPATS